MTRKLALIAGVLLGSVTAGSLLAQTTAPAQPSPNSSMQHRPAAPAKTASQDSTKAARHAVWTKEQITEAQQGLAKAGDYKGKPTGVMDHRTRRAIREYQKANKLPVTGRLNTELLDKLHSS